MTTTLKDLIDALREKRGWSLRRMAAELHMRSANALVRLCQETPTPAAMDKFARALRAMTSEPLDAEELAALDRLQERVHLGDDVFHANRLLLEYLDAGYRTPDAVVRLLSPDGTAVTTLCERYAGVEDLRILVFNCEYVTLFADLARLIAVNPAPVRHYVVADGPIYREVERLRAILPILYSEHYSVYSRDPSLTAPMGIMEADMMVASWRRDGQSHLDHIIFFEKDLGVLMENLLDTGSFNSMTRRLAEVSDYHPVSLSGMDSDEDFLAYCRYCADLERDRTVMRIKPDLGIEQVPVDILSAAFTDGCPDKTLAAMMLPPLQAMFSDRSRNASSRRQPQYHVFTPRAMWRFVQTGRLSDHPYVLRPFTMAERAAILRRLLQVMDDNPYFHVHFFRHDLRPREAEAIFYEGKGLSLVKPHTDYHLSGGHSEIMISQPRFLRLYKEFFLNSILRYHVLTGPETLALLSELLRYAQDHPD